MDIVKLKKYGSNDLIRKIRTSSFNEEERNSAIEILKERGVDLSILGFEKVPQVKKVPQELINWIDSVISKQDPDKDLINRIGDVLGETEYDDLSESQIEQLNNIRMKKSEKVVKEKKVKAPKEKVEKVITLTEEQKAILNDSERSKSDKIRDLHLSGLKKSEIVAQLGIHYSFAFKVIRKLEEPPKEKKVKAKKETATVKEEVVEESPVDDEIEE